MCVTCLHDLIVGHPDRDWILEIDRVVDGPGPRPGHLAELGNGQVDGAQGDVEGIQSRLKGLGDLVHRPLHRVCLADKVVGEEGGVGHLADGLGQHAGARLKQPEVGIDTLTHQVEPVVLGVEGGEVGGRAAVVTGHVEAGVGEPHVEGGDAGDVGKGVVVALRQAFFFTIPPKNSGI